MSPWTEKGTLFTVSLKAGTDKRVNNFKEDIRDSEAYAYLIQQIAPKDAGVHIAALERKDLLTRAEGTLDQAEKIDCRAFVTASDVVNGVEKLNLAFVANLFNNYPALDDVEGAEIVEIQETREEKSKPWHLNVFEFTFYDSTNFFFSVQELDELFRG